MKNMFAAQSFFDTTNFPYADLFSGTEYVWEALAALKDYIDDRIDTGLPADAFTSGIPLLKPLILYNNQLVEQEDCLIIYGDAPKGNLKVLLNGAPLEGASVIMAGTTLMGRRFSIGQGVLIESGALLKEPAIIGDRTEIRQGAYLRGYCLLGKRCVAGHTTEIKHSVFLNDAKAGHFAYLGDSILGENANLGAGTKLANLRFLPGNVQIRTKQGLISTGLRKFGAILGDRVQTGCNSVTNPGTLIGPDSLLMPNTTSPSGYHAEKSVIR